MGCKTLAQPLGLVNQEPCKTSPAVGTGVVCPLNEASAIKKSHAADAFQKEKCAGCGEALPFFGIIITGEARFCQYHFTIIYNK